MMKNILLNLMRNENFVFARIIVKIAQFFNQILQKKKKGFLPTCFIRKFFIMLVQVNMSFTSEFSFSLIGCHTKTIEASLPKYLLIDEKSKNGFLSSPRKLTRKWNSDGFV